MRGTRAFGTLAPMAIGLPPVDPALVAEAAALDLEAAAARHASLAAQVDRANELYYGQDAPELSRRRVRRAVPPSSSRSRPPTRS